MMLLAQGDVSRDTEYVGWYIGLGIGFAIVVVVVILVAFILSLATRIGSQAHEGIGLMDEARYTTDSVWGIQQINVSATAIWRAAERARRLLGG